VEDMNGAGMADFVGCNCGSIQVLLSNSDCNFSASYSSPAGIIGGSAPVIIADFNKDGNKDVAVFDQVFANTILEGKATAFSLSGDLSKAPQTIILAGPAGQGRNTIVPVDLNHDGIIGLVTYNLADFTSPSNPTPSSRDLRSSPSIQATEAEPSPLRPKNFSHPTTFGSAAGSQILRGTTC
jgi:FG-GAP-like repeat